MAVHDAPAKPVLRGRRVALFALGMCFGMLALQYGSALGDAVQQAVVGALRGDGHMGTCRGCKRVRSSVANASSAHVPGSGPVDVHRVMIIVITGAVHHQDRVETILDTWGRWVPRERLLFISDADNATLGTIGTPNTAGGHGPSQRKWFYAPMIAANASRAGGLPTDWFVVADDDTFLLVPNLLTFLGQHDPKKRAWFGQTCSQQCGGPCVCGGAGWAASAPLFLRMADDFEEYGVWPPPCCAGMYWSDQVVSKYFMESGRTRLTESREWGSQPPDFYLNDWRGLRDKPQGWGRVVSFHYLDKSSCVKTRVLYALAKAIFDPSAVENTEYHTGVPGAEERAAAAAARGGGGRLLLAAGATGETGDTEEANGPAVPTVWRDTGEEQSKGGQHEHGAIEGRA
jgi:hypothetical protein